MELCFHSENVHVCVVKWNGFSATNATNSNVELELLADDVIDALIFIPFSGWIMALCMNVTPLLLYCYEANSLLLLQRYRLYFHSILLNAACQSKHILLY